MSAPDVRDALRDLFDAVGPCDGGTLTFSGSIAALKRLSAAIERARAALDQAEAAQAKSDARRAKLPLWGCIWCDASFPRTRQGNADRERHQADCDVRPAHKEE